MADVEFAESVEPGMGDLDDPAAVLWGAPWPRLLAADSWRASPFQDRSLGGLAVVAFVGVQETAKSVW